jgi:hypothetical protein
MRQRRPEANHDSVCREESADHCIEGYADPMMRALIVSVLVASGVAGSHAQQPAVIDAALVKTIESRMVMPKGAQSLTVYQRFYAVTEIETKPVVRGVFVSGDGARVIMRYADPVPGAPGAHVMRSGRNVPSIMGGGCSVVETVFDLAAMTLLMAEEPRPGVRTPTAFCHAEG